VPPTGMPKPDTPVVQQLPDMMIRHGVYWIYPMTGPLKEESIRKLICRKAIINGELAGIAVSSSCCRRIRESILSCSLTA